MPADASDYLRASIHPGYLKALCDHYREQGHDVDAWLKAAGLAIRMRQESPLFLAFEPVRQFIRAARQATDSPLPGLTGPAALQTLVLDVAGRAVLSSPTAGRALETLVRFSSLRLRCVSYSIRHSRSFVHLEVQEQFDFLDVREYFCGAILLGVVELLRSLDLPLAGSEITLPCDKPGQVAEYEALFAGIRLRCSPTGTSSLSLPKSHVERPNTRADRHLHQQAVLDCERLLARNAQAHRLTGWIRDHLVEGEETYPTLAEVADLLGLSPRTVIRRLKTEGASYQGLLDEVRRDRTAWYLINTGLSVEAVAEKAGYEDPSNFSRTFRRWTGLTPAQFRRDSDA